VTKFYGCKHFQFQHNALSNSASYIWLQNTFHIQCTCVYCHEYSCGNSTDANLHKVSYHECRNTTFLQCELLCDDSDVAFL